MSTEEVLCQISTFIAAGHETTASALVWTLYELARRPDVQEKLQKALDDLQPSDVDVDSDVDVETCQYLDFVVRESLRLHAPVTSTMRVCAKPSGDFLPLSSPYTDKEGIVRDGIRLNEHDIISIPMQAMNKSKKVWGEDADVFRPERHAPEEEGKDGGGRGITSGMWGNILTFGGGRRGCIGYRFALLE